MTSAKNRAVRYQRHNLRKLYKKSPHITSFLNWTNFTISAISITLFWGITTRNIETYHVTEHPSNQLPKYFSWGLFQEGYVKYFCFILETFHLVYQVNNQQPLSRRTNRKSDKQQAEPESRTEKKNRKKSGLQAKFPRQLACFRPSGFTAGFSHTQSREWSIREMLAHAVLHLTSLPELQRLGKSTGVNLSVKKIIKKKLKKGQC